MAPFIFLLLLAYSDSTWSKPIGISDISELTFGTGAPGDSALVIPPGTTENANNGSFRVTGDKNTAFTIALPSSATITTGAGVDSINITNFVSYPASGLLSQQGRQDIFIGATRAALKLNQRAGTYTGSYAVTVVY